MRTPAASDFERVRRCAAKVLRENHIVRPPVFPREIAASHGLDVQLVTFGPDDADVAGMIEFDDNVIYVNAVDAYNRQTFTIAHELGHFLLHRPLFEADPEAYKVLLRRPIAAEHDPIEKEANAFAADLLVPRKFLDFYKRYASQQELADVFAVSPEVIRYRMGFDPAA